MKKIYVIRVTDWVSNDFYDINAYMRIENANKRKVELENEDSSCVNCYLIEELNYYD